MNHKPFKPTVKAYMSRNSCPSVLKEKKSGNFFMQKRKAQIQLGDNPKFAEVVERV
jgi:hypothetical protein